LDIAADEALAALGTSQLNTDRSAAEVTRGFFVHRAAFILLGLRITQYYFQADINEQYSKSNAKRSLNISPYQNHHCLGEPVLPNRL